MPEATIEALLAEGRTFPPPSEFKRSEEHTSELQSRSDLVCRLLLEKKKKNLCIIYYDQKKSAELKPLHSPTHVLKATALAPYHTYVAFNQKHLPNHPNAHVSLQST